LGDESTFRVGDGRHSALEFDLEAISGRAIARATLELTRAQSRPDEGAIAVYSLHPPVTTGKASLGTGVAAKYPRDEGIDRDLDVIFAAGFESPFWRSQWRYVSPGSRAEAVERDDERKFEPLI